jgi:hypothetical protein
MEIKEPNFEFELPFKKDLMGNYIITPKHIGGRNCLRDLAASKVDDAYIYFINIKGTTKYKIGISTNPKRRLRDISSYLPFELNILSIHFIKDAYKYEQSFINKYKGSLIKNEWFNFDIETVKEIMITLHNKQVSDASNKNI